MNKKNILVVDDDQTILRLIESYLSEKYNVITASDGEDGLKKARELLPDAVILDIIMPKIHGFEVSVQLKNDEKTRNIPIIMMSATGLEDVAQKEDNIRADVYLTKPSDADELLCAVRKVLGEGGSSTN